MKWIILACALVGAVYGVTDSKCPYYMINNADNLAWLNITHVDILYGTVLENKTIDDVKKMCASNKLDDTVSEINSYIDTCMSNNHSPSLPVFHIEGFKKAVDYLCESENLKILENNIDCFKKSMSKLDKCRKDREKEAYKVDKDDEVAKACSMQRAHEYCSDKILSAECDSELSNLKTTMSSYITAPYCNCKETVNRRNIDKCLDSACFNYNNVRVREQDVYEGLLFGEQDVERISDICRSTNDGETYELVKQLKRCTEQRCSWRNYFYKYQIYNKEGIIEAANYFCTSTNYMNDASQCIKDNFPGFSECQRKGREEEETQLMKEENLDIMNKYVCRRRVVTSRCIDDHFEACGTDIKNRLHHMWEQRAPRMCRTDCQPLGYGAASGITSSITIIVSLIVASFLFGRN